jgi:hypothetical protein
LQKLPIRDAKFYANYLTSAVDSVEIAIFSKSDGRGLATSQLNDILSVRLVWLSCQQDFKA